MFVKTGLIVNSVDLLIRVSRVCHFFRKETTLLSSKNQRADLKEEGRCKKEEEIFPFL